MELPLTNEAAIHRLVDDILAYIFFLNATAPDPDGREHATTVASSQVCMRWRSIALHCHTIWGPIIDYSRHSLRWITILLDRSHPSSLNFGSRITRISLEDLEQGVLELVFNHIERLRIFNLQIPPSCWGLLCSRFLQQPAPNLEFVNVIISYPMRDGRRFKLTHPLFDHHAPNLQNLQLHWCTVDFTSPILTHLTELYVNDIDYYSRSVPTVLEWLNILGGMPSLRWVTLIWSISSVVADVIYPIIHLAALEMLSVGAGFRESVTLVEHLITPPRCGLRLHCEDTHVGFDQRKIWAIIAKKMDSCAKNAPNRYLEAWSTQDAVAIGNLHRVGLETAWGTEAEEVAHRDKQHIHLVDPVITITLHLSNPQDTFPPFLSLFAFFEQTFFDTTHLKLCIQDSELRNESEVFLPLVALFRGFANLEEMYLGNDSLLLKLLPLLQHSLPNSILLPALQSLRIRNATFRHKSKSLLRVADFLRWRIEQGFPIQKIHIVDSWINKQSILTHIQGTVVEIDDSNLSDTSEDEEEDYIYN